MHPDNRSRVLALIWIWAREKVFSKYDLNDGLTWSYGLLYKQKLVLLCANILSYYFRFRIITAMTWRRCHPPIQHHDDCFCMRNAGALKPSQYHNRVNNWFWRCKRQIGKICFLSIWPMCGVSCDVRVGVGVSRRTWRNVVYSDRALPPTVHSPTCSLLQ